MRLARVKNKILLLAGAILIVVFLFLIQNNVKEFFYSFSGPIQKNLWEGGANVSDFFAGVFKKSELESENEKLNAQNRDLLVQVANLNDLEKENETLREALDLGLNKEFRLFLVEVVGKDIGKDSIVINKGSKDGLAVGLPLITSHKVLLGKITEIYNHYSKVALITDPSISFGVKIIDKDILGQAKGGGGQRLFLDMIPKDEELNDKDVAVSTSLGGIFPEGLLVGQIKNIKKSDTESFQKAEIQPAFNINELNNIFVIIDFDV